MHETIICKKIIDDAKAHGDVKAISIEVGQLAEIHDHELRDLLTEMTDWKVEVVEKEALVKCLCGYEGIPKITEKTHDITLFECPKCKKTPKVLEGNDIIIKNIEV